MRVFQLAFWAFLAIPASLSAQSITIQATGLSCTTSFGTGTFQALSWNSGVTNTGSKASFTGVSVQKNFDECSTALFTLVANGAHLASATLTQYDKNNNPQMIVQLTTVVVESYQVSSSTSNGPIEEINLNYQTITIKDPVNNSQSCWNLMTNSAC